MIHDFVDDDFVMEHEIVRGTGCELPGEKPLSNAVRMTGSQRILRNHCIKHVAATGSVQHKKIAGARAETQRRLGKLKQRAGSERVRRERVFPIACPTRARDDMAGQWKIRRAVIDQLEPKTGVGRRRQFVEGKPCRVATRAESAPPVRVRDSSARPNTTSVLVKAFWWTSTSSTLSPWRSSAFGMAKGPSETASPILRFARFV